MSFSIERGLFTFDFTDYHAILGVPVGAEFNEIRKRYLKIARRLHPDSCKAESEAEKKLASDFFSKLVSPAYSKFSNERERAEYTVLLGMIGKRVLQEGAKIQIQSDLAKQLSQASELEKAYKTLVGNLAEHQYESLAKSLEAIAQISELNMVYLMRKESKGAVAGPASQTKPQAPAAAGAAPTRTPGASPAAAPPSPPPAAKAESRVAVYYRRAEEWVASKNFAQATLELKDALKIEPKNSRCHGMLGMVYLKQNQPAMAKVHINKALELNPSEPVALEAKKLLAKPAEKPAGKGSQPPAKSGKPEQPGGGFFGGLFGGKKK
ncbi:J domain-containing protein [Kamptonema formosum]|uniref:J domain-containing protein n=1 Tax=Kamptonema formosum TaxID=331992 RepID=UPI0003495A46|nr:J domain-containing protein [Oscillatoria sp. PCC 10802]